MALKSSTPAARPAPPKEESLSRKWLLPDLVFLLLMLVLSIVWIVRAADADTFWGDEVFSVRLAQLSTAELIERTSFDAHPPLYYLILQGTFWLSEQLGHAPGVLAGRSSGLAVLLFSSLAVWWLLQPLAGRIGSAAIAAVFALQPGLMDSATEMRNYALEIGLLGTSFVVMCRLMTDKSGSSLWGLWVAYFALGSAALWGHLLAAIPLAFLGVGWLVAAALKNKNRQAFLLGGIVVQALIIACFFPWLWKITHQTDYLDQVNLSWMTDPTVGNLVRTVAVAFPFGRRAWYMIGTQDWALFVGIACFLIPFIMMTLGAILRGWNWKKPIALNTLLGLFGLFIWVGHIVVLWLLARFEVVEVFHAPRYPALTSGVGCIGVGLILLGIAKQKWLTGYSVCFAALPLMVVFLAGQGIAFQGRPYFNSLWTEFSGAADKSKFPPTDEPLYFYPEEMIPFFPQLQKDYEVLPYSSWRRARVEAPRNLNLAFFPVWSFHKHESLYLSKVLIEHAPFDPATNQPLETTVTGLETPWMYLVHATDISPEDQRRLNSLQPETPVVPVQTRKNQVFPQDLHPADGWWRLMLTPGLAPYCLGLSESLGLRLAQPLTAGNWVMLLEVETIGVEEGEEVEVTVEYAGNMQQFTLQAGKASLSVPMSVTKPVSKITLSAPLGSPVGSLEYLDEPGAIPKDDEYAANRRFSLKFYGATFERN